MGIILQNEHLTVTVKDPGECTGTRFDRTGFVTQVTMAKEGHTFCTAESLTPGAGTGGSGLCNEFGIGRAIGYEETDAGGWFPKPGVGLLQKPGGSAGYRFDGHYPVRPFETVTEASEAAVRYEVRPLPSNGYAMELRKEIVLEGYALAIRYQLINCGDRSFETDEYVHNFLSVDSSDVGGQYELRLPAGPALRQWESDYTLGLLTGIGQRAGEPGASLCLSWNRRPDRPFYAVFGGWDGGAATQGAQCSWELVHKGTGAGVRELNDFPVDRLALWGDSHVVSPEAFVSLRLAPGEIRRWNRVYQFFAPAKRG